MSKGHRKVGTKKEQDTKRIMLSLSFILFPPKVQRDKKNNGKLGMVIMDVRFCFICKTTPNVNVSSAKENCYFQPYFLFLALQFHVCLEPGYSPM